MTAGELRRGLRVRFPDGADAYVWPEVLRVMAAPGGGVEVLLGGRGEAVTKTWAADRELVAKR